MPDDTRRQRLLVTGAVVLEERAVRTGNGYAGRGGSGCVALLAVLALLTLIVLCAAVGSHLRL